MEEAHHDEAPCPPGVVVAREEASLSRVEAVSDERRPELLLLAPHDLFRGPPTELGHGGDSLLHPSDPDRLHAGLR